MNDDELFDMLRRARPEIEVSVHRSTGPEAATLMEQIMNTPTQSSDRHADATATPAQRRWWLAGLVGVAAVALIAVGVAVLDGDPASPPVVLSYNLGSADPTMTSCMPVAEIVPPPGTEAFGGVVESVADGIVTLTVDEWLVGGPADLVRLDAGEVPTVALDGVEFVVGQRYLVSIWDGAVGVCGTSGPATPELQQQFDVWFG